MAIDISAQAPASRKALTTARRASRIEIGPSVAFGATACTARAKFCSTVLLLESPVGATSMRAWPSGVTHWLFDVRRQVVERHLVRLEQIAQIVERGVQRLHEYRLGALAHRRIGFGERRHRRREAPRRDRRRSRCRCRPAG